MKIKNCGLEGCFEITPNIYVDNRGTFVKIYNQNIYESFNFETKYDEEYYSTSKKRVLRGMHFQIPPHQYTKIVYCVYGKIFDVLLDLREGSPSFKKHVVLFLNSEEGNMVYMPEGIAHGFYTLSEKSIVVYKVSRDYSAEHDTGIRWDSAGIPWPDKNPILSKRDSMFLSLGDFASPFRYREPNRG